MTFRPGRDYLFPYYRDLTTCVAAGLTAEEILLNGMSKATDVASGGRHMSNHFAKPSIGIQNVSSCVSNHSQHAAGLARAVKTYRQGRDRLLLRSASPRRPRATSTRRSTAPRARSCPVVFVVQDNGYGISVPKSDQTANLYASDNFSGFQNLKIIHCDGLDVFDSFRAMREAVAYVRSGAGAAIVHATCVRIHSHSNSDRQELYRTPEELAAARAADPLPRFRTLLLENGLCQRGGAARDRGAERAGPTRRRPTAPKAAPSRIPRRSTSSSCPSPGCPKAWPEGLPDGIGRRR